MKELKGHQVYKKGTLELQEGKRTAAYPFPNVFFELFRSNIVYMTF